MKDKENKRKIMTQRAMMMFAESTGWIAAPVITAVLVGRWLDAKNDSEPLYSLSLTLLAFIVSSIGLGITGVKYIKKIEKEEAAKKEANKEKEHKS